jgi:hypothetical protein
LLSRDEKPAAITVPGRHLKAESDTVLAVRDLSEHKNLGNLTDHLILSVGPHATALLKLQPRARQAKNY